MRTQPGLSSSPLSLPSFRSPGLLKSLLSGSLVTKTAARLDGTSGALQGSALVIDDTTAALSRSGAGGVPIQGTNTNDSASAGQIGEVISSVIVKASAVPLTSATNADITSLSLTAGDWDVYATLWLSLNASTTITIIKAWISSSSATEPSDAALGNPKFAEAQTAKVYAIDPSYPIGAARISLSGTTTIYFSTAVTFTVSTAGGYGVIWARRAR